MLVLFECAGFLDFGTASQRKTLGETAKKLGSIII